MKIKTALVSVALAAGLAAAGTVAAADTNITAGFASLDVIHNGKIVKITRNGDKNHRIPDSYQRAGRHCPPFCVQPMSIVPGVETLGELEVLGYLKQAAQGDDSVLVVDSRTPDWVMRGTIPGSVNIPWNKLNVDVDGTFAVEAEADTLEHILKDEFGATKGQGGWDFSNAKTLVLFCNGAWCPQSSINIKTLRKLGYPAEKLKWYRGGMQDWVTLGLTSVRP